MKKKKIIIGVVIVAIVAGSVYVATKYLNKPKPTELSYTKINKGTLINSMSAEGVLESTDSKKVYTVLNYKIKKVNVTEGSYVNKGDTLCVLDTIDLQRQLAEKKADLDASQKVAYNKLENDKRIYVQASDNLSSGQNSQITNAKNSLKTAKIALDNAQKNYDDKVKEMNDSTSSQIVNANNSITTAQLDLDNKSKSLNNKMELYDKGVIAEQEVKDAQNAVENAKNSLANAKSTLTNAQNSLGTDLSTLKKSLDSAKVSYDNAVESEKTAVTSAKQDLENYQNNVDNSQISYNSDSKIVAIKNLEAQLSDSTVIAPQSGTITAVYAKEGSSPSGLLFVIEDTNSLKIQTSIKEYDLTSVSLGQDVVIKTDATKDKEYKGKITKIAPASTKTTAGDVNTDTTNIEFAAEVSVANPDKQLKIGMSTKLTIILTKVDDTYYVPIDSVTKNKDGQSVIYVAERSSNGSANNKYRNAANNPTRDSNASGSAPSTRSADQKVGGGNTRGSQANQPQITYSVKEVPVKIGIETDFYIQIKGDNLTSDMIIFDDPHAAKLGKSVVLKTPFASSGAPKSNSSTGNSAGGSGMRVRGM